MNRKQPTESARLGLQLEPELRVAIEAEAERRHAPISYVVRAMLRDQLAIMSSPNQASAR
jgi:hypothetical protein